MNFVVQESPRIKSLVKTLAYGDPKVKQPSPEIRMGRLFRLERGFPYVRQFNRNPLVATPQFRALTLYTPNTKNAQIPANSITSGSIVYPTLAKL